ncbi:MAG: hypothetical protein M3Z05_15685 [Gemmatimonadota bacterium]|nr:hypothetical protein [Gemmatimonadota bacterium]
MNRIARLTLAAALVIVPAAAQAQITGSIAASATVATVFSFGTPSGITFKSGVATNVTPGSAASGSGYIALTRNVGVIYTLPDAANTGRLSDGATTPTYLSPSYTCGVGSTSATIVSVFSSCTPATGTTAVATLAAPTATTTEYVIFNGSLLATQTDIAPGVYSGTIRITATAN